jgi:hypothetical protein
MPKSKRLPTPHHRWGAVTLLLMQPLPPLPRCCSQHQAAAAVLLPSCRRKAAVTAATALVLFQCCHRCRCHYCRATAAAIKLLLSRCRQLLTLPPPLLRYCNAATATAATAAALPLMPPSYRHQAATPKLPQLPPPSCRCRRATAKLLPRSPPPSHMQKQNIIPM